MEPVGSQLLGGAEPPELVRHQEKLLDTVSQGLVGPRSPGGKCTSMYSTDMVGSGLAVPEQRLGNG